MDKGKNPLIYCWEIQRPLHGNSLPPREIPQWKYSPTNPIPPYFSLSEKIPFKTSVYLPITNTICKQWAKFITCSPSLGDCGGLSRLQRLC